MAFGGLIWPFSLNVDLVDLQINLDNPQPLNSFAGILWPYYQPVIYTTTNLAGDLRPVLVRFSREFPFPTLIGMVLSSVIFYNHY